MTGLRLTRRGQLVKLWLETVGVIAFILAMPVFLALVTVAP